MLLMGKLTISTGPFSIAILNYQRVASFPATFCDMEVSIAMGVHQKLMLYFTENPAKKMIWGYPDFRKPLYINVMNSLSALSAKSGKKMGSNPNPPFVLEQDTLLGEHVTLQNIQRSSLILRNIPMLLPFFVG